MVYFWDLLGDHAERWAKPFLGHNWAQKPWNCPKKLSRKLLIVESWLTLQNDCKAWFIMGVLRYVYFSDSCKCPNKTSFLVFWGPVMTNLHDYPYLMNLWSYKISWHLKMITRMDLLEVLWNMYTPETTGSSPPIFFFFFFVSLEP